MTTVCNPGNGARTLSNLPEATSIRVDESRNLEEREPPSTMTAVPSRLAEVRITFETYTGNEAGGRRRRCCEYNARPLLDVETLYKWHAIWRDQP